MSNSNEEEAEVRLAHATLRIYEVMFDYCQHIHISFSEMLKNTEDMEMDDNDKALAEWMKEQVNLLESIFTQHAMRKQIIEQIMAGVLAESNKDPIVH
tara:strand:+ start:753 stop:1046 length:294 start_codon:yes stop_codon:yes gene_type:complete